MGESHPVPDNIFSQALERAASKKEAKHTPITPCSGPRNTYTSQTATGSFAKISDRIVFYVRITAKKIAMPTVRHVLAGKTSHNSAHFEIRSFPLGKRALAYLDNENQRSATSSRHEEQAA